MQWIDAIIDLIEIAGRQFRFVSASNTPKKAKSADEVSEFMSFFKWIFIIF